MSRRFIKTLKGLNGEFLFEVRGPTSLRYEINQAWLIVDEQTDYDDNRELQLMSARSIITTEIKKLPPRERQIIRLYLRGKKIITIAKQLKITSSTVSTVLKRVGGKMRKFIPTFQ